MPQLRPLIAGNWKMNGLKASLGELGIMAEGYAQIWPKVDLLVCPPATLIYSAAAVVIGSRIQIGAQDCHVDDFGANTGDISAPMLADAGARWVIVGHSERRANHNETSDMVRSKVLAAVAAGLTPIVCVGETADQRGAGRETEIVGWQISGSLPKDFSGVVAYEPVWAVGTGTPSSENDVAVMHKFIREELRREFGARGAAIRILYGGSVKPANAAGLLSIPDVNGALIGGASLIAADFLAIAASCRAAAG